MKKIIIINGPNLNLLGNREKDIYGDISLQDIEKKTKAKCKEMKMDLFFCQSNNEGELINFIQSAEEKYDGLIINPAAFTHTSVALLDALRAISKPKIEIHLSNIYNREDFRKKSVISDVCKATISGKGKNSYLEGLRFLIKN